MNDNQETTGSSPVIPTQIRRSMFINDNEKIKEVQFKYPALMSEDATQRVREMFDSIVNERKALADMRMEVMRREQELKEREKEFQSLSSIFTLVFEKREIQEIRNECNLSIVNPSDYRNK